MTNEPSKPKIVLDTKPFVKLFAKEEGWETIQKILSKIEEDEIEATIARARTRLGNAFVYEGY